MNYHMKVHVDIFPSEGYNNSSKDGFLHETSDGSDSSVK